MTTLALSISHGSHNIQAAIVQFFKDLAKKRRADAGVWTYGARGL